MEHVQFALANAFISQLSLKDNSPIHEEVPVHLRANVYLLPQERSTILAVLGA